MKKINAYSLYLVLSSEYCGGRCPLEIAQAAIAGGIDMLQLREKLMASEELRRLGKKLSTICQERSIVFIANDDPHLARDIGADGVHLGQEDLEKFPLYKVRELLGPEKIIGVSTHSLEQIQAANSLDINYIAYGPVFETKTKNYCLGTQDIAQALAISQHPVFAIGGIHAENMPSLLELGVKNIALIRGISEAKNITQATTELKRLIRACQQYHEAKN